MKVLFVDDDIQLLKGLRRMLTSIEEDWEADFVTSGDEALRTLSQADYDVMVTDMRMPGMDGAELLKSVSTSHPQVVRIVLSGQASRESVYRAVRPMHQYLEKPCDAETLRSTVSRACELRDVLHADSLKQLVSRIDTVPSVPSLYNEIVAETESPDGAIQRVGEIIAQDPGMTAKILQIANSALFGLRSTVYSAAQATSLLGMEAVKSLVLSVGVFQQFDGHTSPGLSIESLFRHSLELGGCARLIAREELGEPAIVDCAFTAGMLQDIGRLVLATGMPNRYADVLAEVAETKSPLCDVEAAAFGASHAAVGAYLLELWGLPQTMAETVAFHETPNRSHDVTFTGLTAVVAANALAPNSPAQNAPSEEEGFNQYVQQIGLTHKLPSWREACQVTCETADQ